MFRNVVATVRKERSQLHGAYIVLAAASLEHGTTRRSLDAMGVDPILLAGAARTEADETKAAALERWAYPPRRVRSCVRSADGDEDPLGGEDTDTNIAVVVDVHRQRTVGILLAELDLRSGTQARFVEEPHHLGVQLELL